MSPKGAATFRTRAFCIVGEYADYPEPSATVPNTGQADGRHMTEPSAEHTTLQQSPPINAKAATRQPADALAFTVQSACALTGLGRTTMYALMRAGTLRRIRIGGRTLIAADSLRAMLAGGEA